MSALAAKYLLAVLVDRLLEHGVSPDATAHDMLVTASDIAVAICGARKTGDILSLILSDLWTMADGQAEPSPDEPR